MSTFMTDMCGNMTEKKCENQTNVNHEIGR